LRAYFKEYLFIYLKILEGIYIELLEIKIFPVQSYFVMVVINSGKGKRTCSQTQKENNTRHKVRCFGLYQGICSMYFPAVFFLFFLEGYFLGRVNGLRRVFRKPVRRQSNSNCSPSTCNCNCQKTMTMAVGPRQWNKPREFRPVSPVIAALTRHEFATFLGSIRHSAFCILLAPLDNGNDHDQSGA